MPQETLAFLFREPDDLGREAVVDVEYRLAALRMHPDYRMLDRGNFPCHLLDLFRIGFAGERLAHVVYGAQILDAPLQFGRQPGVSRGGIREHGIAAERRNRIPLQDRAPRRPREAGQIRMPRIGGAGVGLAVSSDAVNLRIAARVDRSDGRDEFAEQAPETNMLFARDRLIPEEQHAISHPR